MAVTIGVGAALRRAREIRGITLDEACRDTKLRLEQLRALEAERFDDLGGEVYVRAQLRTYAEYLGLRSEKVVAAYVRHAEDPEPPLPPDRMGKVERAIAATRIRDNQRFLLIAAVVVLLALIAVGLVSRHGAPPAAIPTGSLPGSLEAGSAALADVKTVDVTVVASDDVEVSAIVDGSPEGPVTLRPGEVVSYSGAQEVTLEASDGGLVDITVNGRDLGAPGPAGEPWTRTWTVGTGDAGA